MNNQPNATRLLINGVVQGVGFRPTAYRIAHNLNLGGWVRNTSSGVELVLCTLDYQLFFDTLQASLPPLASLDSVIISSISLPEIITSFTIQASSTNDTIDTIIPPDNYICRDCITEILDPASKYYLYSFTNCTNCGPRYSVIRQLPYDRQLTALADFPLCPSCIKEYTSTNNRRHHAQATSCPQCGPQLDTELSQVAAWIQEGLIVAVKGIGGYVLVADASNNEVVNKLRQRKKRNDKPFAIMCLNSASIHQYYAALTKHETALLESPIAPIVLLKKYRNARVAEDVAPRLNTLGVMLPYSPLYLLLFYYLLKQPSGTQWLDQPYQLSLVVTSANFSGGSIISNNDEAQQELQHIADKIVTHNRDIVMKSDDSVMMCLGNNDILMRRSRGFAPRPYYFPYKMPQVLGLGAQLKNTITFTRDNKAFTSQYMGDMDSPHTVKYFKQVLQHFYNMFDFTPQLVVSDLHPDFYTTQYAQQLEVRHIQLQHHYAHFASVLANAQSHNKTLHNTIIGCILDGYGYAIDGSAGGGELLIYNTTQLEFNTISKLTPITIPGGDIAEREPWRLAIALCVENQLAIPQHLSAQPQSSRLIELINRNFYDKSTAFGRYFSAIAGLLGIVTHASYEAQAPMELESRVTELETNHDYARMNNAGQPDFDLLFRYIYQVGIVEQNVDRAINLFYGNMIVLIEQWILFHCSTHSVSQVAISGGAWQSRYLLPKLQEKLQLLGIELLIPYHTPVNDESISLGQAWYGAQLLMKESPSCV